MFECFFYVQNLFVKKKKINRLEIFMITSYFILLTSTNFWSKLTPLPTLSIFTNFGKPPPTSWRQLFIAVPPQKVIIKVLTTCVTPKLLKKIQFDSYPHWKDRFILLESFCGTYLGKDRITDKKWQKIKLIFSLFFSVFIFQNYFHLVYVKFY